MSMLHSFQHLHNIHRKRNKQPKHRLVMVASIVYPLSTLPQVIEIFKNHSATNVSLTTYLFYLFFTFVFLGYGISEKLKPIVVLQSLWLLMYGLVVIGILFYS